MRCKVVNPADRCKELDAEMVDKARINIVPEDLIKFTPKVIKRCKHLEKRLLADLRRPMEEKKEAGWDNFLRGKILRFLGEFQLENNDIEKLRPYIWQRRYAKLVPEWVNAKWVL